MTSPTEVMEAVWGDGWHSLGSAVGKAEHWRIDGVFDKPGALLDRAEIVNRNRRSVWFDFHPMATRPDTRGAAELVAKVVAIPCDLDWHDPDAHSELDLPTEAELRHRLRGFRFQPSVLICSGHGLQPWWLLDSPVDAEHGAALIGRLHAALAAVGMPPDREDLASMLRVPGSINWKTGVPIEVVIEHANLEHRYAPEYLDKHLPGPSGGRARKGTTKGVRDRGLDAVLEALRADNRDQDAAALAVLVDRYKAHDPFTLANGDLFVTRPDKPGGKSASVGFLAPGVVNVLSTGWAEPKLPKGKYRLTSDGADLERDDDSGEADSGQRRVALTAASTIKPRPVKWLWHNRIALGTLALLGGREGIGKSILTYQLTADITRGHLAGIHHGTPRAVLVCATEDSWEHTIVPRLMAAGADLERVYRIDVTTSEGVTGTLTLPTDLGALEGAVAEVDAAAIVLDPLLSRLSTALDTHKDAEVRVALEPLVALADRTRTALVGLIHVNKATTVDPLTMLMASRAFAAVARAVLFVAVDPDDETGRRRYLGQPKNNLGKTDLPLLAFTIESTFVADTDEGEVWTGRVKWLGEDERSIADVLRTAADAPTDRTDLDDAAGWLRDYLDDPPVVRSDEVKAVGKEYGHKEHTLKRARREIGAGTTGHGFPRRVWWSAPGMTPDEVKQWLDQHFAPLDIPQPEQSPGETHQLVLTVPTEVLTPTSETVGTVGTPLRVPTREVPTSNGDQHPCPTCLFGNVDELGFCSERDCPGDL